MYRRRVFREGSKCRPFTYVKKETTKKDKRKKNLGNSFRIYKILHTSRVGKAVQ
jgi:hypothetical protein